MSQQPTVSVVVVSRGRPEDLRRALVGVSQLQYPAFEVVVVTDHAGQDMVAALPFADQIKLAPYEVANIAAARNRGIAAAAGEIVAFLDDDAVPETGWLHHLMAPFARADVAAATGFLRGRNGISLRWRGESVDGTGATEPLDMRGEIAAVVLTPKEGRAIKTAGPNMAVRRDVLATLGGFDPAFRFALDVVDLNLRLARAGHKTAVVPLAEVHHGAAQSAHRTKARVPRDLSEIGASMAVLLHKHCPLSQRPAAWTAFRGKQRRALVAHMVVGDMMPGDVGRLMRGLEQGYLAGAGRVGAQLPVISRSAEGFRAAAFGWGPQVLLSGRAWRQKPVLQAAEAAAKAGQRPSVFVFSRTALFHHMRFDPKGYWLQTGGLFGRSERDQSLFRLTVLGARLRREVLRVAAQRMLAHTLLSTTGRRGQRKRQRA